MFVRQVVRGTVAPVRAVKSFRPDIEGLRALAVGLVVLDHLVGWPRGGFIGVDIFFVISGFLITGLLLKEVGRTGRISFRSFYLRRARRILPVSTTVLVVVVLASHLVFRGERVAQTKIDAWWSLGFLANRQFSRNGTDYFAAAQPSSLVQHYWSLSVEEQFYLVWPLVIALVINSALHSRFHSDRYGVLLGVMVAASTLSLIWAVSQTKSAPAAAYFSTPVRAWELGAGAIIAVLAARRHRYFVSVGAARRPLFVAGLLGILLSAFVVQSGNNFPAPAALLPVLSTCLIIVAGIGGPLAPPAILLTNRASRYIGRISFSIYLWHWPTIQFLNALLPDRPRASAAIAVFAMLGLSIVSFHFIESPLRHFSWRDVGSLERLCASAASKRAPMMASVVLLTTAAVSFSVTPTRAIPAYLSDFTAGASAAAGEPLPRDAAVPSLGLSNEVNAALRSTSWPDLQPAVDQLGIAAAEHSWTGCRGGPVDTCTFGNPNSPKSVLVIGDSYAMSWLPAIRSALLPHGWVVRGLTMEGCPANDTSVKDFETPPRPYPRCDARHREVVSETAKINPDAIILASADTTLARLASGKTGADAFTEYHDGLVRTVKALQASNRKIVTLSPPPSVPALTGCYTVTSVPSSCVSNLYDLWKSVVAAEEAAASATNTSYIDTRLFFCSRGGYCPAFVGRTPVRWDAYHLTDAYGEAIGPDLRAALSSIAGVS